MKIDRFSICQTPETWRLTSNDCIDQSIIKIQIYISNDAPIEFITSMFVVDTASNQTIFDNDVVYNSGTLLINADGEWMPPDDSNNDVFILCDNAFANKQTLQGNTQHGYREFSNITLADL